MSLTIGELFAGYGGLGMGVASVLDAEIAWYSEIDKGALKVLAHRFPDVPNIGDITTADWPQVRPVDILTGGSPCQDLSHAGKRAGMTTGTRSNLWVAMREAIAQLRPRLVIWENVRGAYSAAADSALEPCPGCVGDGSGVHLRALGRVLGDLSDLGYVGGWHGLRAADIGAPHGRFRVVVVAADASGDPGGLEHGDGCAAPHAESVERRQGRLATRGPQGPHAESAGRDRAGTPMLPTPTSRDHKGHNQRHDDTCLTGALLPTPRALDGGHSMTAPGAARHVEAGNGALAEVLGTLLPTPRATDGTKGGPNQAGSSGDLMLPSAVQPDRWGQYAAAIRRWEALTRPAPPPTETGPKGKPRLSAAFSEWLMGLPAGWVTDAPGITRNEALKALGNGVVPQQAAAAVAYLLGVLSERGAA